MFDLEIQLQTAFYLGFSKRNITSVQTHLSSEKILLAEQKKDLAWPRSQALPVSGERLGTKVDTQGIYTTQIYLVVVRYCMSV